MRPSIVRIGFGHVFGHQRIGVVKVCGHDFPPCHHVNVLARQFLRDQGEHCVPYDGLTVGSHKE